MGPVSVWSKFTTSAPLRKRLKFTGGNGENREVPILSVSSVTSCKNLDSAPATGPDACVFPTRSPQRDRYGSGDVHDLGSNHKRSELIARRPQGRDKARGRTTGGC